MNLRKQKKKPVKSSLLKFVALMMFLMFLLIFFIVFIVILSIGYDPPEKAIQNDDFSEALIDSINMYGTDFTSALSVYIMEFRSFSNYDKKNFSHSKEEIKKFINEESELKKIKETFDNYYGGIVEKQGSKEYYNWYFPIASGYETNYTNDWGNSRTYGGERTHKGTDIMCEEGSVIVAVESGTITNIGWNDLGGWRIGIESSDDKRYWYYAHMRKIHPYVKSLKKGSAIKAGQVIGYVGSTGYSSNLPDNTMPENSNAVDGKFDAHLHIGVYIKGFFGNEAYNPFPIMEVLKVNKINVSKKNDEYVETKKSIDERLINIAFKIDGSNLGQLSQKYESSGNPGTIANIAGDIGGKSYGAYQLASNMGSVNSFLMWLSKHDISLYNRLNTAKQKDGGYGTNFDREWKAIAREQTEHFYNLQYAYIKSVYFDPLVNYYNTKGFFIERRSMALQNTIFSLSVQHGVGGAKVIINKQNLSGTDRNIIIGIYEERMKVNIYFSGSSQSIKNSVYYRFKNELQDSLNMLTAEGG